LWRWRKSNLNSWMLSMLLQAQVRGRRKKTRALARCAGPGARDVRMNGPPNFGPILAGTRFPFAHLFCHFESVMDITRGILGLVTDLVFGTPKTLAVPSYKYARVPARNRTQQKTHNTPRPACCAAAYATSSCLSACTSIGRAGLRNLVLSDTALGEGE
jgi:hypothetical protein